MEASRVWNAEQERVEATFLPEDDPIESGLSPEMIALSAYRVYKLCTVGAPDFENLEPAFQQEWLEKFVDLDNKLAESEGRPVRELVEEMRTMNMRTVDELSLEMAIRMAWMLYSTETNYSIAPEALLQEEQLMAERAAERRAL